MTDLNQYKKLTDIEHVRHRSGMYLGSTANTTVQTYLPIDDKMVLSEVTYSPALVKMFDEIVSNAVDEHIRSGNVTKIFVTVDELLGSITVEDNGGIPVKKHPEFKEWIPTMIFGELRTGSNFDDSNRTGAGLNGLGSKLTSIFSTEFTVETCDGSKLFSQTFYDGLNKRNDPVIVDGTKKGTKITFYPDFKALNCDMTVDNVWKIKKRVYDVAGCNPKIRVYYNGDLIKISKFIDYVGMYCNPESVVDYQCDNWHIAVAPNTDDTFKHISFVNGVDTFNGGSHIDYISNQVTNYLREYINKKHKVDIKPNNIKQQLMLFINCTVNAPIFTSQTKEYMSLDVKDYGTECILPEKFMKRLIESDILQRVLDWVEAEQRRKELAELRKLTKQTQNTNYLKKIVKFDDASSKSRSECSLFLTEGDSAAKSILSSRDPNIIGVFPLKGKPLNVRDIKVSKLTSNEEFANIMAILGLKLGHDDLTTKDLRFGKLIIAADFDPDGSHICGLVINMFQQFWPNLIKEGFLYRLRTPLIVATFSKQSKEFFSRDEYQQWERTAPKHTMKYYKGLGSFDTKTFKKYMNDPTYHCNLVYNDESDFKCIDLAFDRSKANDRKEWLLEE